MEYSIREGAKVGRIKSTAQMALQSMARWSSAGWLAVCIFSSYSLSADLARIDQASVHGRTAHDLFEQLQRHHVKAEELDDDTSGILYDRYIETLDPSRAFFTESDMIFFKKYRDQLDDYIKDEDTAPAFEIFNRLNERRHARFEWLIDRVENHWQDFDFSLNDHMLIDRSEEPWAKSDEQLDEIWQQRLKDIILEAKLAGGETDEEIQQRLLKRYSNSLKRLVRYNAQDVFTLFVNSYTTWLDPHTVYLPPPAFENFNISMSQSLEGIGAVLAEVDDYVQIQRVLPDSPASKSGTLTPNTRILAVGQGEKGALIDVVGWRIDDVVKLIRGPRNSIVRLKVKRPRSEVQTEPIEVSIVRNRIKLEEQAARSEMIEFEHSGETRRMGVIRISSFYADYEHDRTSSGDVERLLAELQGQGAEGVVIDLRNNGGGLLQEANALAGLFIDAGPIVQVRQHRRRPYVHRDLDQGVAWSGPVAVLVNRLSASASEIFAAALQDYGRGPVIGERTFGKGTIQELIPLQHGQIKLTQGRFYRISGVSTQHAGVTPDIAFPESIDPKQVGESAVETALPSDSIKEANYSKLGQVEALSPILRDKHRTRIEKNPDFRYTRDMAELAKELRERTHVSLNLELRRLDKQAIDARRLAMENQLRESRGEPLLASLDELFDGPEDVAADDEPDVNSSSTETGETPTQEASNTSNEPEESDLGGPFVTEAMRILADYSELSKRVLALRDDEERVREIDGRSPLSRQ